MTEEVGTGTRGTEGMDCLDHSDGKIVRLVCWLAFVPTANPHRFKNTGCRNGIAQLEQGKEKLKAW